MKTTTARKSYFGGCNDEIGAQVQKGNKANIYRGSSSEAARQPLLFYIFLLLLFPCHGSPWESMAAHKTPW